MTTVELETDEAPARALAMIVAANGHVDPRELGALQALDAFRRLRVSRKRFVDLARGCIADVGSHLGDRPWLCIDDLAYIDALLDSVSDAEDRMLVCRLAAAVVTADGRVSPDERLVLDHALARWHIHPSQVTRAILRDRMA